MPNRSNVTVVGSAYDTSGNGGRKLVKLSNGWLVCAAYVSQNVYLYKSSDNGTTWAQLCYINHSSINSSVSIVSNGTKVYVISTLGTANVYCWKFDATNVLNINLMGTEVAIDSGQSAVGLTSLAIDSSGSLHAVWSSKNGSYPNSFNIRYSKSTDGGTTWIAPTQLTTTNSSGTDRTNPCIVIKNNGNPLIVYQYQSTTVAYAIYGDFWTGSAWNGIVTVYNGGAYVQQNPCAVVDSTGHIHVVWMGLDSTDTASYNICYSESTDGGTTWSARQKLTSGNIYTQQKPSITIDKNNNLYVIWYGLSAATPSTNNIRRIVNTGSWGSITELTSNTTSAAAFPSTCESCKDFTDPLCIYQDQQAGAVKFRGSWSAILTTILSATYPTLQWTCTTEDALTECVVKVNGSVKATIVTGLTGTLSHTLNGAEMNFGSNTISIEPKDNSGGVIPKLLSASKVGTPPYDVGADQLGVEGTLSVVAPAANELYAAMTETNVATSTAVTEDQFIGTATPNSKVTLKLKLTRDNISKDYGVTKVLGGVG